ncbi:hypothetical protein N7530_002211 [Penicillium desertorum]|uniref:Uncharacterized protein n=1 Tax=Penicillium desertorum TaxID=1303715 RepID=A0A9W9XC14_9EURO|nr:hypothetical protein N7530_002211 [Penicillium desertorum]
MWLSAFMNLYETFAGQIQTFRQRYENIRVSVYKQQLLRENVEEHKEKRKLNLTMGTVHTELHSITNWLVSDDPVLADLAKTSAHLAPSREEMTCLWISSYLEWFLKNADIPAETTPRSVARSLLLQLFTMSGGSVPIYQVFE